MTFWSALFLGLLASAHCAAMCSGLQMAMQAGLAHSSERRSGRAGLQQLGWLNAGRLTTYVVIGGSFAALGVSSIQQLPLQNIASVARTMAGVLIVLMGVQLMLASQRPFQWLERVGQVVWATLNRWQKLLPHSLRGAYLAGLVWGFLPCGLIYSVVLTAAFAPSEIDAVLITLGFGVGTLPAMILTGSLYDQFTALINATATRLIGGALFIMGGLLMLTAPLWMNMQFTQGFPELLQVMFCVNQ